MQFLLSQEQSSLDSLKARLETEGMAGVISVIEASHYKPAEPERTWYGNVRTHVEAVSRMFPSSRGTSGPSDSIVHHMGSELFAQSYIDEKIEDGSWLSMSQSQRASYQRDKFLEWKEKSDRAVGEHLAGKVGEALSYIPEKVGEAITHLLENAGSRKAVARDAGQAVTDVGEWIGFGFGAATTKIVGQSSKLSSMLRVIRKKETIQTSTGTKVIHKVVGVEKTQIHHILSDKSRFIKDHKLLAKIGFDLNDPMNKMLLPTVEGAQVSTTTRTVHQGRHVEKYSEGLAKEMTDVYDLGVSCGLD